jgi:hypothetical protein
MTTFRLFWRLVIPTFIIGFLMVQGVSFAFWLGNQPEDLAVAGGMLVWLAVVMFGPWAAFRVLTSEFNRIDKEQK